jgi:hypothetical protein
MYGICGACPIELSPRSMFVTPITNHQSPRYVYDVYVYFGPEQDRQTGDFATRPVLSTRPICDKPPAPGTENLDRRNSCDCRIEKAKVFQLKVVEVNLQVDRAGQGCADFEWGQRRNKWQCAWHAKHVRPHLQYVFGCTLLARDAGRDRVGFPGDFDTMQSRSTLLPKRGTCGGCYLAIAEYPQWLGRGRHHL